MHRGKRAAAMRGMCLATLLGAVPKVGALSLEVEQITTGPQHHFFGYLGRAGNVPWSQGDRHVLALRVQAEGRGPNPNDEAEIVVLDAQDGYAARGVDRTRVWAPGEGGLLFWNPAAPATQFFFNDRDPRTGQIFSVLFDLSAGEAGERVREYRYQDPVMGNTGVAQRGGSFLGLSYDRILGLRSAAGNADLAGQTPVRAYPVNDGVFKVEVASEERTLMVSFVTLAATLKKLNPDLQAQDLFIDRTLWSRDDSRVFFFVHVSVGKRDPLALPFLTDADGSNLRPLKHPLGGQPDWLDGYRLIGALENRQVVYDTERMRVTTVLGGAETFPDPEGDIAVSPDGAWFVNGYRRGACNYYVVMRLSTGKAKRSPGFDVGGRLAGEVRLNPAPCWNRASNTILAAGLPHDSERTRQLFLIRVRD